MKENLNKNNNNQSKKKDKIKSLDFINFYNKDKYLFRIIDETKTVKKVKPYLDSENDLREILTNIKNELNSTKEPKIRNLKTANEEFSKNYKKITKKKNNLGPEDNFRDIIEEYKEKRYQIPNLTVQHNIFKMNPLIEDNDDKMYEGLYSQFVSHTESNRGKKVAFKTINYLKRLKNIVEKKIFEIHKNKKENITIKPIQEIVTMPVIKVKGNKIKEESKREILEKIKILLELIKDEPLKDYTKSHLTKTPKKYKINKCNYPNRNIYKPNTSRNNNNIVNNFFSSNQISNSFKKLSSQSIIQNKKLYNTPILNSQKSFYLLSDSKNKKKVNNFLLNSPKDNNNIPRSRNKEKSTDIKFLNTQVQSLDNNRVNTDSNTNRGFNNTNYTNNTNHTTQNFFYRPKKTHLQIAYESLVKDNFNKVEETLRNYLKKVKDYSDERIDHFLSRAVKNNFIDSVKDIKDIISSKNIRKKSEKIYLNEQIIQRIKPKLQKMFKEEKLLKTMDKKYIRLYVDE
jgi:hypothetical protein